PRILYDADSHRALAGGTAVPQRLKQSEIEEKPEAEEQQNDGGAPAPYDGFPVTGKASSVEEDHHEQVDPDEQQQVDDGGCGTGSHTGQLEGQQAVLGRLPPKLLSEVEGLPRGSRGKGHVLSYRHPLLEGEPAWPTCGRWNSVRSWMAHYSCSAVISDCF